MATTYYYSANGETYGESTSGKMTTYMSDALGSTIGTFQNGAVVNSYLYSPYGTTISKTGTGPDPRFLYNGKTQSRTTGRNYAEQYNKRRYMSSITARWTTVDLLWPDESPYVYVDDSPATFFDPSGYQHSKKKKRKRRPVGPQGGLGAVSPPMENPFPDIFPTRLPIADPGPCPNPGPGPGPWTGPPWWLGGLLRGAGVIVLTLLPVTAGGHPGHKRIPLRKPGRFGLPVPDSQYCEDLYQEYQAQKKLTRPCLGGAGGSSVDSWIELAQLQLQFVEECDEPGGGGKGGGNKIEGHILNACEAIANAMECDEEFDPHEFPTGDFSEWIDFCDTQAGLSTLWRDFPRIFGGDGSHRR